MFSRHLGKRAELCQNTATYSSRIQPFSGNRTFRKSDKEREVIPSRTSFPLISLISEQSFILVLHGCLWALYFNGSTCRLSVYVLFFPLRRYTTEYHGMSKLNYHGMSKLCKVL